MNHLRALLALVVVAGGLAIVATTAAPAGAGAVVTEEVTYRSTAPDPVTGTICRPASSAAGPYPILVLNHGGFRALRPDDERVCAAWAADGWFVVASHYRPMNTGPAGDDLCEGEVDDVLALLAVARTHPAVDGSRVVMRGGSHGGCVTLRAYERGVPGLLAAAALMPLSDLAATAAFAADPGVRAQIARSTGGDYASRTPRIVESDVPLLITHGVDDRIIDAADSCRLVAGQGFTPVHVGAGPVPDGCARLDWSTADSAWSGDRWFLLFDGVGHSAGPMGGAVDAFLRSKAR